MNEINFLPQSYRCRLQTRLRRLRLASSVLIVTLGLFAYWAYGLTDTISLRRAAEAAENRLASALARESQVQVLREQKQALSETRKLQRELQVPIRYFEMIQVLSELTPEPVALTELVLVNDRPATDPYVEPGTTPSRGPTFGGAGQANKKDRVDRVIVSMVGYAPDDLSVAEMIAELNGSEVFRDVKLSASRFTEVQGVAAREFGISATVDLTRDYIFEAPESLADAEAASSIAEVSDEADY